MNKTESKPSNGASAKKRLVVSYENMSAELQTAFKEKYPKGYADYMGDIRKVEKPDGSFFYTVSVEIPEAICLVKISVKVDGYEDAEKGIFSDSASSSEGAEEGFPDENDSSFSDSESEED